MLLQLVIVIPKDESRVAATLPTMPLASPDQPRRDHRFALAPHRTHTVAALAKFRLHDRLHMPIQFRRGDAGAVGGKYRVGLGRSRAVVPHVKSRLPRVATFVSPMFPHGWAFGETWHGRLLTRRLEPRPCRGF